MRCFIGVPLPEHVKRVLVKAQDCFRKVDARMSIVSKDNLHVTLNFLDDVSDVSKIDEALKEVKLSPFKASLKNISFFPKRDYIRVIHSPINKGKQEFLNLYEGICAALKLNKEERFSPHVTLARVKFVRSTNTLARACYNAVFEQEFDVDSFNLYSSKLTPKGSVYTILGSYP